MTPTPASSDLTRTTLTVLVIGLLIAVTFWIVRPFLSPILWAGIIVVATWPFMLRLQGWLGGSRRMAVLVMTVLLLLTLIVPLLMAIGTIYANVHRIGEWAARVQEADLPLPPAWLASLPVVGAQVSDAWRRLVESEGGGLVARATPYVPQVVQWFVAKAGSAGLLVVNFLLTIVIAALLYAHGEVAGGGIRRFARRLGGNDAETVAILAAQAVRGVALGVVVTALVQAMLTGLGLAVAGIPAAGLLTAVTFMLCLAQLPPFVVLLPAVAWLYWSDSHVSATLLLVWAIPIGALDNVLRPALIRRGADLPLILVFAGAMGGLVSLGIMGVFIGPTALAVTYTLLRTWTRSGEPDAPATSH